MNAKQVADGLRAMPADKLAKLASEIADLIETSDMVYRAWNEDRPHVNKMLAMGCALQALTREYA